MTANDPTSSAGEACHLCGEVGTVDNPIMFLPGGMPVHEHSCTQLRVVEAGRWEVQMWANGGRGDDYVLVNTANPQAPTFSFGPDGGINAGRGLVYLNDLEAALKQAQESELESRLIASLAPLDGNTEALGKVLAQFQTRAEVAERELKQAQDERDRFDKEAAGHDSAREDAVKWAAGQQRRAEQAEATVADLRNQLAEAASTGAADQAELIVALRLEVADLRSRKDGAYEERNRVVAALARIFPSGVAKTAIEGWDEEWHGCVYIDSPEGQLSWHFHDLQAFMFEGLPPYQGSWDGHTTEEKYLRLSRINVDVADLQRELATWKAINEDIREALGVPPTESAIDFVADLTKERDGWEAAYNARLQHDASRAEELELMDDKVAELVADLTKERDRLLQERDQRDDQLVVADMREDMREQDIEGLQQERDDAVKALRGLALETIEAGYPGGDREQALANVRQMRHDLTDLQQRLTTAERKAGLADRVRQRGRWDEPWWRQWRDDYDALTTPATEGDNG